MSEQENIIVFRQYENSIDASLAKSKLDAYGVPCFLTEENISNLYPGPNLLAIKVRLHLFAHDKEKADQILREDVLSIESETTVRCPKCQSTKIERTFPRRLADNLKYILFGVFLHNEKVNHCLSCDTEFS
jgi:hypothetical protein